MIRTFKSRALQAFWRNGNAAGIRPDQIERIRRRLGTLDAAIRPEDMDVPGYNFHRLRGRPARYTVHVNGPRCLTFEWDGEDALRIDLVHYH
jgi:proteic killer suppression protein